MNKKKITPLLKLLTNLYKEKNLKSNKREKMMYLKKKKSEMSGSYIKRNY